MTEFEENVWGAVYAAMMTGLLLEGAGNRSGHALTAKEVERIAVGAIAAARIAIEGLRRCSGEDLDAGSGGMLAELVEAGKITRD